MKRTFLIAAAIAVSAPAAASTPAFRVELAPANGKMIRGHAGLHAVDDETALSKVRIVAPGMWFRNRGTIRVLVLNHGNKQFVFGPDQVRLQLLDGTALKPVPLSEFEKGAEKAITVMNRGAAIDMQVRNTLSSINSGNSGDAGPVEQRPGGTSASVASSGQTSQFNERSDDSMNPGARVLDDIGEVLMPEVVPPTKASGGYLVFNLPAKVSNAPAEMPLTILVTTGGEVHRFHATLKRKN